MKTLIKGVSVKRTPEQIKELHARCQADIEARKAQYWTKIDDLKYQVGTANENDLREAVNKLLAYRMALDIVEDEITQEYRILYGTDVFPVGVSL